jgi:hypothetical protein
MSKSITRSMFSEGFTERRDLEQYIWTEETVRRLMHALEFTGECCCLTTPSLAHAWHEEGRDEALYDIDTRFKYLPKFRYWDLRYPEATNDKFRIIVFDPPFFYIPMEVLFDAVKIIVNGDFGTKILLGFLKREEAELMKW